MLNNEGVGLPGIVAAKCGSDQVILSDNHSNVRSFQSTCLLPNPDMQVIKNGVETIQLNTDIEEHRVCWSKLEWGSFDDNWYNLPMVTVGLAADCLYDSRQFDVIAHEERNISVFCELIFLSRRTSSPHCPTCSSTKDCSLFT